mmetsp:Transcript_102499/g.316308  ORF Transcript_102499/g.316308 Transcript_102499/m.316308 type:complete len:760 (+) Transcript_102499:64-2343(+)
MLSRCLRPGRSAPRLAARRVPLTSRPAAARGSAGSAAARPWVVSPEGADLEARTAASVREHGFAVLPGLLSQAELERLRGPLLERTERTIGLLRARGVELEVGSRAGFHEVVLRSPGRYDVPCDFEDVPQEVLQVIERLTARALSPEGAADAGRQGEREGPPPRAFAGIVRADPGSPAQLWHADSPHLREEHAPANLINVLVALDDVAPADGPTEILPGSQVLTNHLRRDAGFDGDTIVYQNPQNSPALIGSSEEPFAAAMPAGSVLLFDDRILHRGGGNAGERPRDIAFFSYRRADFQPATHYEAVRSLEAYDHAALAESVRPEFPGLAGGPGGAGGGGGAAAPRPPVLADGASGSQLHESAIAAMTEQLRFGTANMGGSYATSERALATVKGARGAVADLLNCEADEAVFGASMTALAFHLARALRGSGRLGPGDNVVLDPISHGANVFPWKHLAEACGAEVRWLPVAEGPAGICECILDTRREALAAVVDGRTRLVAAGAASNGVGSVHDVRALCAAAGELSEGKALRFVDAVHYAPHGRVDVQALGCDFLACSPYKFFGPHSGVLFGRRELLAELPAERLDCQDNGLPREESCHMSRWEVGTQSYESLAGVVAAVDYIAGLGARFGGADAAAPRPARLEAAWRAMAAHEQDLKVRFLEGAASVRGLRMLGVRDPQRAGLRTATFAVAKDGLSAQGLAQSLCERGVWCTAGNHYAAFWSAHSGGLTDDDTGMCRLGFLHYNTLAEVDRVLQTLDEL